LKTLIDLAALKERLRAAFVDLAAGRAADPRPLRIDGGGLAANYVGFPCHWPAAGLASVKALSGAYDTIVLASPGQPRDELAKVAQALGLASTIVGDAYAPRDAEAAILDGFQAGMAA